ncbi:hypothetical protein [Edaphobacter sp. HDX4]|uniref:hypothetical protein n=1 Tax=Edaphobacter sp. HDX4 TaxID=2794064 RepID=UPI002FE5074B
MTIGTNYTCGSVVHGFCTTFLTIVIVGDVVNEVVVPIRAANLPFTKERHLLCLAD